LGSGFTLDRKSTSSFIVTMMPIIAFELQRCGKSLYCRALIASRYISGSADMPCPVIYLAKPEHLFSRAWICNWHMSMILMYARWLFPKYPSRFNALAKYCMVALSYMVKEIPSIINLKRGFMLAFKFGIAYQNT
jgi:hypothetical protein